MQIKIDNKIYNFSTGETVLDVCKREGINVPRLCHHPDLKRTEGLCRLCLVKTNKTKGLVTSCQTLAENLMEVVTEDEEIQQARKINLELLWAEHAGKCAQCQRNGDCELQSLAHNFGIQVDVMDFVPKVDQFEKEEALLALKESLKNRVVDEGNNCIKRDSQYCIECRRCVQACREIQTVTEYEMHYRNIATKVGTAYEKSMDCIFCGQCANLCPTAAIVEKDETKKMERLLKDPQMHTVFYVAPSVRVTIGEEFGLEPGVFMEHKINTALRELGADKIFDINFGADLTIMEEAHELTVRLGKMIAGDRQVKIPMFTSCCPSWVLYVEKYWPHLPNHLSSAKSPVGMIGAMVKTYYAQKEGLNPKAIATIAIMPCTSKKFEITRKEMGRAGYQDNDLVVTTREFARYLKKKRIDLPNLTDGKADQLMSEYSGGGMIFGATGGVMEAALRTAYENLTCESLPKIEFEMVRGVSGIREAEIIIPKGKCNTKELKIKVAVVHKIANAKKILEMVERGNCPYHFVEVMACPGGCLGGGGQPLPVDDEIRDKRRRAIYQRDKELPVRKCHENPMIKKIYSEFLGEPGGELSEKYLHTKYFDRSGG
ncbi:MAG TPA: 4Fe-4S binding protein [Candidatus Moranbacteria bacterium]|nr:4Fe-4S binding protein [Candidatus Moranbacteria bacterium]